MKSLSLKAVNKVDAAQLAKLHAESFGSAAWKEAQFKGSLEQPATQGWIIDSEGQSAGFILCTILPGHEAEILTFCIAPSLRRRKLGSLLLQQVVNIAHAAKCKKLFLEVASDNEAAAALYKNLGFKLSGTRPDYYRQGRDSAVDAQMYELTP